MTARTRPRPAAAIDELRGLVAQAASVVERHRTGRTTDAWSAGRLRSALERSLDLLLAAAVDDHLDEDSSRRLIAARDAVASHLRAASEVEAADARPVVGVRLLVRATAVLSDAVDQVAVTR